MTDTPTVKRSLTEQELDQIRTAINDAAKAGESRVLAAITTTFGVLLAEYGLSWEDFTPDDRLDPKNLQIPEEQWQAIGKWLVDGDEVGSLLSWMNWGPSTYKTPG